MISYAEYKNTVQNIKSEEACPVKKVIEIFQGKWSAYVLFELSKEESLRFNTLKKRIRGITNTMLTTTLRQLEEKGLVVRTQYNEIPPHVEYALSEPAREMYPVFIAMAEWREKYADLNRKSPI